MNAKTLKTKLTSSKQNAKTELNSRKLKELSMDTKPFKMMNQTQIRVLFPCEQQLEQDYQTEFKETHI